LTIPEGRDSNLLPPRLSKTGKNQAKKETHPIGAGWVS